MSSAVIDRSMIERLVREAIRQRMPSAGNGQSSRTEAAAKESGVPKLVVNVSARHAHVTQEDLELLFGKGHKLRPHKALYQDGFFAAEETLTMIGPRNRIITGLRILGPCRDHSQVELAFTDSI
ncbi:MAG: PduL/EutD family phosphate acyltransferase, partial [Gemmataceae bacterium]